MTTLELLAAASMDLKRSALGRYRGSNLMAQKFTAEALKKLQTVPLSDVPTYMKTLIQRIITSMNEKKDLHFADDALMYSTLIQNYCMTQLK
jgi:hypothetical protein